MTRHQSVSRRDILKLGANFGIATIIGSGLAGTSKAFAAQSKAVLGHFGSANPQMYGKATGSFGKVLGSNTKVDYYSISAGSQALSAIAGNSMDICNVGSSPMVVGFGQGVPMSMVYVQKYITDSECLVVRKDIGIEKIQDLKGKKIGLPFNTSVHFALVAALNDAGMKPSDVRLLNIGADSITAAWQRKDIDAAYIWVPVLDGLVADNGSILLKTGDLAEKGTLVFDGIVVRDSFKKQHPDLVLAYLKEYDRICEIYKNSPEEISKVLSPYLNLSPETTLAYTKTFHPLSPTEIISDKWMGMPGSNNTGVLKTLHSQAEFLHSAGQLSVVPDSFAPFVDSSFVAKMVGA